MNKLLSFVQSFKSYSIEWIMLCCLSSSFRIVLDFSGTRLVSLLVVYWAYVLCKGTRLAIFVLSC